jgi:hypothetical protein
MHHPSTDTGGDFSMTITGNNWMIVDRDGWRVNMKRVRRLYRLEGLQLRHRVRPRKHASLHGGIPAAASRAYER